MWKRLLLFLFLLLYATACAGAEIPVTLAWDANTDTVTQGYKLHRGTASGAYSETVDVGNVTEFSWLTPEGVELFYAATAYGQCSDGETTWYCESGYSNEVVWTATQNPPPDPATNVIIQWEQVQEPPPEPEPSMAVEYVTGENAFNTDFLASTNPETVSIDPTNLSLSSGDLWVVQIQFDGYDDPSNSITAPVGEGWTAISDGFNPIGVYPYARAFWKNAGASEGTADFTVQSDQGVWRVYAVQVKITGHDSSDPIDAVETDTGDTNDAPSVSVARDDSLALLWAIGASNSGQNTVPSGTTLIAYADGYAISAHAYQENVDSGTYNAGTFGSNMGAVQVIIIQPAAGGSSSVPGSTFKGMFLGTNRGTQRHQ